MKNNQTSFFAPTTLGILVLAILLPARTFGATAPRVSTLTASNVTATTATLTATANPGSATTAAWLEWGPGNAFKFRTAATNIGNGGSPVSFATPISGLTSGIIYRYRAVASNSLGVVRGMVVPFGVPAVTLNGANPQTNFLGASFVDSGAVASGFPAAIAVGDSHVLALKADGTMVGWGTNANDQISFADAATNIVAISAGYVHSLALRADGLILGWGSDEFGQLDVAPEATNVVAIASGYSHNLALRKDGTVASWGLDDRSQVTIPDEATNVVSISAGYTHSMALRADGTVVEWGEFPSGPVGAPPEATNVVAIAGGFSHSLALRANGTVVAWGDDATGATIVPSSATNVVAIAAGFSHSLGLRADGTIIGWGSTNYGEIKIPSAATNIIAIGAGFAYSQALRADGAVIGWGNPAADRTNTPPGLTTNLSVTVTGTVDTAATGTYPLLYSATNIFGFAGTATRNVAVVTPFISTRSLLGNGSFQLGVDFLPGASITIYASTNVSLPLSSWTILGLATESPAGHYQFTDSAATSFPYRFYQARAQ